MTINIKSYIGLGKFTWRALSMASGRLLLSKSWVIELDPLHSVERRLMVVDTVALVVAFVAVEASTDVLSGPPLADTLTEELSSKVMR